MSTSLRSRVRPPVLEPSTDFPTLDDEEPVHRAPLWLAALVISGAILAGAVTGFVAGRVTAPHAVPAPCVEALQAADAAFTAATAQFGTIEAGALTVMEEMTEAESLVQDARLGVAEIGRLRSTFQAAALACRAG